MNIQQAIIKTLSFFAIWNYPLTKEEIYKWMYAPHTDDIPERMGVFDAIDQLVDAHILQEREGRYTLHTVSIEESLVQRQQKWWWAKDRIRLAQKAVSKVRWIPGLEAVYVCNILPVTVHNRSDIDVFVVSRPGLIWLVRLCMTITLSLFSLRRNAHDVDKHVCLSFYATSDALHFFNLQKGVEDVYLLYWLATLIPIYDSAGITQTLIRENGWVKNFLPNFSAQLFKDRYALVQNNKQKKKRDFFLKKLNQWSKKIQLKKMAQNTESKRDEETTDVIVSDYMLKFHEHDRREKYAEDWRAIIEQV